jgi:hypothetical protein
VLHEAGKALLAFPQGLLDPLALGDVFLAAAPPSAQVISPAMRKPVKPSAAAAATACRKNSIIASGSNRPPRR